MDFMASHLCGYLTISVRILLLLCFVVLAEPNAASDQDTVSNSNANQLEAEDHSPLPESTDVDTASSPDSLVRNDVEVRRISLHEAIGLALDSNLDLALSRSNYELAKVQAEANTHAFVPELNIKAGVSRTDGLVQGSFGDFREVESRSHMAGVAISLQVNIVSQIYEVLAARRSLEAAILESLSTEQRLLLNVVELYQNLVLASEATRIGVLLVDSSAEFENITKVRFDAGVGLGADVSRAGVSLAASRQQLELSRGLVRDASIRLAVVLRLDPQVQLVPEEIDPNPWTLAMEQPMDTMAVKATERPDVLSAKETAAAARAKLQAAIWELAAPVILMEWQLSGVGGDGSKASPDYGQAMSAAAGSAGRSVSSWQNFVTAAAGQGGNPFATFSNAAGSGARSFYAYKNLLESPSQSIEDLDRQERYGVWVQWSLSWAKLDRIAERRQAYKSTELKAQKVEEEAAGEVRLAQSEMETAMRLLDLVDDEIDASAENERVSLARYRSGTAIAFEVLESQDLLAKARLKRVQYITSLNIAQARLLAAAGVIHEGISPQTAISIHESE
ncbi:MAG: hypothetical protein AMXMBFR84_41610 [Candidatus Hydrogenedentota bacterium]